MIRSTSGALNASLLGAPAVPAVDPAPLQALTTALARGDDAAWQQFHRDYGPRIFRQLLALARGDHDLASEALQQTYLRVARHARPCACEPMFNAWLRTVARTALSDCGRRRAGFWQLLRRHGADPSGAGTDDEADERLQAAVDRALTELDATDRALLESKYLAGQPVRALAEQLAISPKAVESRLTRARAALRSRVLRALSRHD